MAIDYKKELKQFYFTKDIPVILDIPAMRFIAISGEGDPNGNAFQLATEALYALSYAVKMSYKSSEVPTGYYDYVVFPLEGEWDLIDKTKPPTDKSNLKYTLMIRQPDFLTEEGFQCFLTATQKKKNNPFLDQLFLLDLEEGLCCQYLHFGSYDDEPSSFEKMETYCRENGFKRSSKTHREIYLSDPRKTDSSKLKTLLRFSVSRLSE